MREETSARSNFSEESRGRSRLSFSGGASTPGSTWDSGLVSATYRLLPRSASDHAEYSVRELRPEPSRMLLFLLAYFPKPGAHHLAPDRDVTLGRQVTVALGTECQIHR